MNTRKGMGKGLGCGYKNIAPMDAHIHSLSAKGMKTQSVLKKYNPKGKLMLFNRIDEGIDKPHKSRLYTCTNCGHQYFEDEGTCPVCHKTDILDFDAKGKKKFLVSVDGWSHEYETVAKTEEEAIKNVNEITKGELSNLIEAGGDYNISLIGKKKKSLNAKGRNVKYKMSKEEKEMLAKETPYLKILRNTFKKMSNKENWKLPPKPFVSKSYPLALQVENTYNHFLGGSEMTALPDGTYKVTSKGYYHYIGA